VLARAQVVVLVVVKWKGKCHKLSSTCGTTLPVTPAVGLFAPLCCCSRVVAVECRQNVGSECLTSSVLQFVCFFYWLQRPNEDDGSQSHA